MNKRWRHWGICAVIALGGALTARLLSDIRFFQLLNLKALDAHFVLRGRMPVANIVLVRGDQKALDTFPELRMFWHPYYAEAIRAAGENGAKVIGLDVAFGAPVKKWEADYDRMLAEAVEGSPAPVVCGYVASLNTNQRTEPIPINMLAAALGLDGFANLTADPDDFVRSQELIEAPSAKADDRAPARSLAMRVVEKYVGQDLKLQNGRLTLRGREIPISAERSIAINYAGPPDTYPWVSLADVVAAARAGRKDRLREWMNGKIVLIGNDTAEDRFATPFYTLFQGPRWTTAGVEIHANTIQTILEGSYLLRVPEWARMAGLLTAAIVTVGQVTSAGAGATGVWLLLEGLAILICTHLLFRAGLILSTSEMFAAAAFSLLASVIYRFATAERRGALFHKAISLFVGKELAAALDKTEAISLSGKRLTVTILFTDIRGFTAFTERVGETDGPEVVVQLLNDYMAMMVSIIVKHHGCVNKFIGDGILAVFSDDDDGVTLGDHARRAVRCAAEMVTRPSRFETGAGIHTGVAVVGNVGSAEKMEYTVLGDTVNVASRIESLNKEHHTKLLMSEVTESLLNGEMETAHLGMTAVRGKAAPIKLYTVAALIAESKAAVNA
jgi:adenylate cyclase